MKANYSFGSLSRHLFGAANQEAKMKGIYSFGSVGRFIFATTTAVQRTKQAASAHLGWLALAVAVALLASATTLWSTRDQPAAVPAPVAVRTGMTPEQVWTLPALIQDQVRGIPQVSAAAKAVAPTEELRWEEIITLPALIQEQVRGTSGIHNGGTVLPPSSAVRPEVLSTFPVQVQEQIRRAAEAGRREAGQNALRPEAIIALPQRIQAQVQDGKGTSGR